MNHSKPPIVLIIAGSGPTDRDGNSPGRQGRNDCLKLLAEALADAGIASVRYDKRGVRESLRAARSEADLRFENYVDDATGWLTRLLADERFSSVGVLGHSEGALIAALASQQQSVAALVSIAGAGRTFGDVLREQLKTQLPEPLATQSESILQSLEAGEPRTDVPVELNALYRPSVQPYLISLCKYVPSRVFAKVTTPCLIVQGDTDIQVGISDAKALAAAQPRCRLTIVEGMNHILKLVPSARASQRASYGDPSLPIAPVASQAITAFLREQLTGQER